MDQVVIGLHLKPERGSQVHLTTITNRFLNLPHRKRRITSYPSSDGNGMLNDFAGFTDFIHQPLGQCLLGTDRRASQQNLAGTPVANGPRQILSTTNPRHDPEGNFR